MLTVNNVFASVSKACITSVRIRSTPTVRLQFIPLIKIFTVKFYCSHYTLPGCWLASCCCCPSNDIAAVGMVNCEWVDVLMSTTVGRRPLEEGGRCAGCDCIGGTCRRLCACADPSDATTPVVVGCVLVMTPVELPPVKRDWAMFSRLGSACDKQLRMF